VTLKAWIYTRVFTPYLSPLNASLGFAVAFVALFLGVAWLMWRKRWIVKI
jgi:predicted acyltransferase